MNELDFKIMGLYTKIEKNKKVSKQLKVLALACLFFAFYYCHGTKNIGNIDKGDIVAANLVWLVSIFALIGIYIKDASCAKNNKVYEFDIYRLEVEDLNDKKEIAEITGEILSDNILNKQIEVPDDKVSLPIIYYSILVGIDIIIRIYLFINNIL